MDHLQRFTTQVRTHILAILLVNNAAVFGGWWFGEHLVGIPQPFLFVLLMAVAATFTFILARVSTRYLIDPLRLVWQAVLHLAPNAGNVAAPDFNKAHLGRELVTSIITNLYQFANVAENVERLSEQKRHDLSGEFIANTIPLPVMVLDKEANVVFCNDVGARYLGKPSDEIIGQSAYTVLDISFTNEQTLDRWIEKARNTEVIAYKTWERVRLNAPDQKDIKLFDLVAYYNNGNLENYEVVLALFDRTRQYSQDDQALSFVALAVHELRTPLTLLRGYIEAFEEELGDKLDPEMTGFMHKMNAAAQQLAAFTNNILNVARFESDQLILKLREEKWEPIITSAIEDMRLRAQVRGITLTAQIESNLPTVGADPVSIYEVINNLIDNAIKYSGDSKQIVIKSYLTKEGLIETIVQDQGVGIPENAIPNLFDKFYRNHRNRAQVGGTGMGLYLAKAIVRAHSGTIWVRSKPGQGSTFGFTLQPYSKLADGQKTGDNSKDVMRTAHGWIKNHSLYRR